MQVEHHRGRVRRFDALDHRIFTAPRTDYALGRKDDAVPTGLDVRRRQRAAVVECHPLVQREGIGQGIRRDRPRFGQVADDLRIVMRVEDDQVVVDGAQRLGHREGLLLVHVQAGGIRGQRHVHDPPAPWFLSQGSRRGPQPDQHHHTEYDP